jgi:hypothetical protein
MTECNPSVMRGLLVIARLVKLGGLTMVFGGVFVMLRRLFVMLVNLVLCHSVLPKRFLVARKGNCARNPT